MTRTSRGFTLIELMIVIAIIGLISTIAVAAISRAREKPRNAKRVADIQSIQKGLELYFASNQSYPTVAAPVTLGAAAARALCGIASWSADCQGSPFLGLVPSAPVPVDGDCTGEQNAYTYTSSATSGNSGSYAITFCLGQDVGGIKAGVHTADATGIR